MTGGDDRHRPLALVFYRTATGREPARGWLGGLSRDDRKRVGRVIRAAQRNWPVGMPLVRKMEPGLWELRSHLVDGIARVAFTVVAGELVLLHGFVKKSEKTSAVDIGIARRRRADWNRGWRDGQHPPWK